MKRMVWIVFGWLVLSFTAHAASFDCPKVLVKSKLSYVERLICIDAVLSKLDEEMDAAYKTALIDEKQTDITKIKQTQQQ